MIRKGFLLLSILVFTGCSTAINRITHNGESGSSYLPLCPVLVYSADGPLQPKPTEFNRHISQAGPDVQTAIEKAKSYIKGRGGNEFAEKVVFSSAAVVFRDSADVFRKKYYGNYNAAECGATAYWVTFEFTPYPEADYSFVVAMDEKFELSDDLEFPHQRNGSGFYTILPPEKAAKTALRKYRNLLKNAEYAYLDYSKELGGFVWEIGGKRKHSGRDFREYESWRVSVDAETGKVVGTAMVRSVSHGRYF